MEREVIRSAHRVDKGAITPFRPCDTCWGSVPPTIVPHFVGTALQLSSGELSVGGRRLYASLDPARAGQVTNVAYSARKVRCTRKIPDQTSVSAIVETVGRVALLG